MIRKLILATSVLALFLLVPLSGCSKDKTDKPTIKDNQPGDDGPKKIEPGLGGKDSKSVKPVKPASE
jgi:hypothetical protein